MYRTHTCGELTKKKVGESVTLAGWVQSRRDHGGIIFIDLRDRYGLTQLVFDPEHNKDIHNNAEKLRREWVLQVKGKVRPRREGMINPKLHTGEIEIICDELNILNESDTPPLEVDDRIETNEDFRLKWRFIDLRKPKMQQNLITRHKIVKAARDFMDKEGFLEIETPMMAKSTPEGSRDYIVPSRVHPGKFYALPQSPQLFKQLLMVAGYDRYCQVVRCFRDEDLRADRQPEFTQIDIEMAFIEQDDIMLVVENLTKEIFKTVGVDIKLPINRMSYDEAMEKYGEDSPDTRFELFLKDVTEICKKSSFKIFQSAQMVKCLKVSENFTRTQLEEFTDFVIKLGAKGLAWIKMNDNKLEGSAAKFFDEKVAQELIEKAGISNGDTVLFVADKESVVNGSLSKLRDHIAGKLGMINENAFALTWVVDFPLFEWSDDDQRFVAKHHPFTSPRKEDVQYMESAPEKVYARAYDLVLNGSEIAGGSIRIHQRDVQEKMFQALGISKEEQEKKFSFLLNAFKFGAPPHGGIAFGLDRLAMILTGNSSIREVIAFPKNKNAEDLMLEAPSEIGEKQLKEANIKIDFVKKE